MRSVYRHGRKKRKQERGYDTCSAFKKRSAEKGQGIRNQDAPVVEPDMFKTIWCAVKRQTKSGIILGEEERIDVLNALKAVTVNAAVQYSEQGEKGSLKEGKLADMIIIDRNPFETDIDGLKDIKILETIKGGVTVYRA